MDSLTQIVLGAATGELILGRRLGNKAMLLGAIGGTLPDMDVLYNFFDADPIRRMEIHRGYSHSMFAALAYAAPLAWLSGRLDRRARTGYWYLFWYACFFTHILLDCCTTYGTRALLPFSDERIGFNNISVIDPMYTIPFMLMLAMCLFIRRDRPLRRKWMWGAISYSLFYMAMTFALKTSVHRMFAEDLNRKHIRVEGFNTKPTILNAILWSAVAWNDSAVYTAEYSFLDRGRPVEWLRYERNLHLLPPFECEALDAFRDFSDECYFAQSAGPDSLLFFNVKFGRTRYDTAEAKSAFLFYMIFTREADRISYTRIRPGDWSFSEAFRMLLRRIGV